MSKGDADFDLTTARFAPEDASQWALEDLPAPGEDLTGSELLSVPADLAARLRQVAARDGLTVAEELERLLGRGA
ncbi:hypothetical protein LWF15_33120 [Kineosporia rhizophila]|uniref:hypothetical protein n=1 Tax=Kineosporia TaxID=49184 RepID=UPI001E43B48E|nr:MULTISPECIES: hypothetical protein [Kineosporia]MCE0540346.1 hypothetical protein [Kineosporia rhizophila]GLY16598.1 hypothetical protein Kisp01_36130 [Kineosporia sp. NBRC 101677]